MDIRLTKSINPAAQTSLIKPLVERELPGSDLQNIYYEEQLTEYEFIILEYIGMTNVYKGGSSLMSFQGLKRLINIHQAKLTKALNRLTQKELLDKEKAGYKLSDEGAMLFSKLYKKYHYTENRVPDTLYTHIAFGKIDGFYSDDITMRQIIADGLVGRWFGQYRFTARVDHAGRIEICWISTDGRTSISLIIGPKNDVTIAHSATSYQDVENELEVLIDRISNAVEELIDLPIEINMLQIFENDKMMEL